MDYVIILPTQLFADNDLIDKNTKVYLVEHPVFFTRYNFHKMKLVLHRATMKQYEDYLRKKYKCTVKYIDHKSGSAKAMRELKGKEVHMFDPVDHEVENDLEKLARKYKIDLVYHNTPLFINTMDDFVGYLQTQPKKGKKNKSDGGEDEDEESDYSEEYKEAKSLAKDIDSFTHASFYKWMRKHHNILMSGGKPKGDKWSYDVQNRKPFPKNFKPNYKPQATNNKYVKEAKTYVNKNFDKNPGESDLYIPTDHNGARRHFRKFLKERFKCFGPYQDAVSDDIPFGCHAVISALLNIGLLTPDYVVEEAEKYGSKSKVPMQSVEGFIRQLFWREYCYFLYKLKRTELEKPNHFGHKRRLNDDVWYYGEGSTGMPMIDDMIDKALEYSYLHHIERLMYIGNYMLITEISPKQVHDWFISVVSLDAYHWVMYPNVYGMSQHSAGDLMMNRPYFSSSSYIDKMSTYNKKKSEYDPVTLGGEDYDWNEVWDAIYYNFIGNNSKEFSKNYAIAAQVKHWKKKSKSEQKEIRDLAKSYFRKY